MTSVLGRLAPGRSSKLNLAADLALLFLSIVASTLSSGRPISLTSPEALWFAAAAAAVWVVTATALRHYDPWADRDAMDEVALAVVLVMAVATVLTLVNLCVPSGAAVPDVGRFVLIQAPVVIGLRFFLFRPMSGREAPLDEVLIVGTGPLGRFTGEDLQKQPARRSVLGYLSFPGEQPAAALRGGRFLGTADDLEKCLRTFAVSEVYIAGNLVRQADAMQAVIRTCEQVGVPFALPAHTFRLGRARPVAPRAIADGYIHYMSVESKPQQMAIKRLFDILVSAVALWALLPLFFVVAGLIKLSSRGPVFFKQVRVGLHGKHFHMLKFRSMVVNAEALKAALAKANEQSGPVFKIKKDPRITWIGRFIRKFSIDELPQLINVLRGDMSLVGPRPPVPSEVVQYEPWQRRRLSVRPGITCIWQVSGRNELSFKEWMYLDMRYIDHWSLTEDLSLILRTVPVVLTGRGAS